MPDLQKIGHNKKEEAASVKVQNVHKSYGKLHVLKGVSLEITAGEIFAIMGPSGSGKSVLLRQISGLETPDSGKVEVNGHIPHLNFSQDSKIGMVFQSGALLSSLTVEENVGLFLSEHRIYPKNKIKSKVTEKLKAVGLEGIESKYPNELSGGMKKRVAIARTLVVEPQLILYDEPTSELDPISAVTVAKEIKGLKNEGSITSIMVTHDRDLVQGIADRVAVIRDGTIIAIGTPDEIWNSNNKEVGDFIHIDFNVQSLTS